MKAHFSRNIHSSECDNNSLSVVVLHSIDYCSIFAYFSCLNSICCGLFNPWGQPCESQASSCKVCTVRFSCCSHCFAAVLSGACRTNDCPAPEMVALTQGELEPMIVCNKYISNHFYTFLGMEQHGTTSDPTGRVILGQGLLCWSSPGRESPKITPLLRYILSQIS